jgi:hypothetical protein
MTLPFLAPGVEQAGACVLQGGLIGSTRQLEGHVSVEERGEDLAVHLEAGQAEPGAE